MRAVSLDAPAKVNLHLGIYPCVDEQGYHRADSLMVALEVADEVVVTSRPDGLRVRCEPDMGVPEEQNTAYKAAKAWADALDVKVCVDILIRKRVPSQAGLGGGSSDAAAVLCALCELWNVDVSDPRVVEAARRVGADVPFFLDPVPTLLVGRGDVVDQKFAPMTAPVPVVLVRPAGDGVSTPAAYRAFDEEHDDPVSPAPLCELLRSGVAGPAQIAELLSNNLDPVACRLLPQVAQTRAWLLQQPEVLGGQVSGSGSCVFGICATPDDASQVASRAREHLGPRTWTCATSF